MIYNYECDKCNVSFDVIKPVNLYNRPEPCTCGEIARKTFSISRPIIDKTSNEYNPALGTVVKNKAHKQELMKQRGLIEVGNEKPETIHKEMNKTLKHKQDKIWDDL
jgi:hypothetical protein